MYRWYADKDLTGWLAQLNRPPHATSLILYCFGTRGTIFKIVLRPAWSGLENGNIIYCGLKNCGDFPLVHMIVWWEADRRRRRCDPGRIETVRGSAPQYRGVAGAAPLPPLISQHWKPDQGGPNIDGWREPDYPPSLSCQPASAAALGSGEGGGGPDAGWISNALQINKFPPLVSRVLVLHGPELSTSTISSQLRSEYFQRSICRQLLSWLLWEQFSHWFPVWLIKYRVR